MYLIPLSNMVTTWLTRQPFKDSVCYLVKMK